MGARPEWVKSATWFLSLDSRKALLNIPFSEEKRIHFAAERLGNFSIKLNERIKVNTVLPSGYSS